MSEHEQPTNLPTVADWLQIAKWFPGGIFACLDPERDWIADQEQASRPPAHGMESTPPP